MATGFPPYGSFGGGTFDTVNLANLNVHFSIPVISKQGRGMPFNYAITYDSSIWSPVSSSGAYVWTPVGQTSESNTTWGWGGTSQSMTGYVTYAVTQEQCSYDAKPYDYNVYSSWVYYDGTNTAHPFSGLSVSTGNSTPCTSQYPPYSSFGQATDGSGWQISVTASPSDTVYSVKGAAYNAPLWGGNPTSGTYTITDMNSNVISYNAGSGVYTDTLGTTALTVTPGSLSTYAWSPPNGGTGKISFKYTAQTVRTNFGCSGISEYGATQQNLVSEIDLPDGTKYTFLYEATPSYPSDTTGRLASVTLPTGGTIKYTYAGGSNGITCNDGSAATLYRYTPDTGSSNYWEYTHAESGSAWTTTVYDPTGNETAYNFQGIYQTEMVVYQGSSPALEGVNTCYNSTSTSCNSVAVTLPITERTVTTTLYSSSNNEVAQTVAQYSSTTGLVTLVDEYDYGSGSPPSTPKREAMTCYTYSGYDMDLPSYVLVYSSHQSSYCPSTISTTNLVSEKAFTYDALGNLKSETDSYGTASNATLSRSFVFGPYNGNGAGYGALSAATDYNGNTTNFTYSSTGSCNGSFPTTITLPNTSLSYTLKWSCSGGVLTSIEDPNNQPTTFSYTDPNFWRPTEIQYPDGGSTTYTYTDTQGSFSVATARAVSSSLGSHTVTQYLDPLGRVNETVDSQGCITQSGGSTSTVFTHFDMWGRVYTVTNPYCSTSDPTYGVTTYGYDALNRTTSITYPDTAATTISYTPTTSGNCSTTTDPAGKARTTCSDALGRLTSVVEGPGTLKYQTSYTYNLLNDLTGVTQGSQSRTYLYDMLGRLTSAATPEAGTTTYTYPVSGSLCSGSPTTPCTRTDARSITTTYTYNDPLNRLTSKTYSDTTPPASFSYDQSSVTIGSWSSGTLTNPKGRMTEATTTSSGSIQTAVVYSYDPVGRIKSYWQCNPSNCGSSSIYNTQYNYDLAGDVTSWTHPGLISISNTVDAAQQITEVQTSSQYTNLPQTLLQNITYTAFGAVSTFENGCAGTGCLNALETYQYNKRLQPAVIELGTTSNTSANYCLVYNYYASNPTSCALPSPGTNNNGNVDGYLYQDSVNSSFSHTASYTYDNVNRLTVAQATGNSTYNQSYSYTADGSTGQYGNMTCVSGCSTPNLTFSASTNQIISANYTYDAAGELTKDSSNATAHTYQWDAEGRVSSVDNGATWGFTYNALGHRVQWTYSNGAGAYQQMFDPNGGWLGIYGALDVLRWGNGAYAWYNGTETYFNHINNLSSTTMMTNHAGAPVEDVLFYPWGQAWKTWGGGGNNFAELPYDDATTNTNLALYRLQSPGLGRWLSPDPLGGDITNPQSLNRYGYVLNNPTTLTDPLGLWCIHGPGVYGGCGGAAGDWGWGTGPYGNSGTSIDSGDSGPGNSSIFSPVGPWDTGIWGSVFGSGPLSGDFGPMAFPSGGGWSPPCDFGTCSGPPPNAWVEAPDQAAVAISTVIPPEYSQLATFLISFTVAWPFLPEPGQNPLYDAGMMASPVASPWAPVAWYGTSALVAVSPAVPGGIKALYGWATLNPIAWRCATSFAFNLLSPLGPYGVDTDEYPCGRAGQMASGIVWPITHPNGQ